MPAEKINHTQIKGGIPLFDEKGGTIQVPQSVEPQQDPELSVRWGKEQFVQIAVECDVDYLAMAAKSPDGSPESPVLRSSVYTPTLTREELNKLIRVLRRARDQAFGRDE